MGIRGTLSAVHQVARSEMLDLARAAAAITAIAFSSFASAVQLVAGWNLVGNNSESPIPVSAFADTKKINSVWKWNAATSKWAFYSPQMSSIDLSTYATSRGYEALTSIPSKDGYWINSKSSGNLTTSEGSAYPSGTDFALGWNLAGGANNQTVSQFVETLNQSLATSGKQVSTVWTWDSANTKWRFYAPALAAQGGTALADNRTSKGYAVLTSVTALEGVWVNVTDQTVVTMLPDTTPWFHTYYMNADGSESLVLTTMGIHNAVSDPTQVMMLKPNSVGVANITSQVMVDAPYLYWGRNVVSFKDPLTGQPALWFCNQGREVGDYSLAPTPRVNGVWGEQDRLYVMSNSKFVERSEQLPQVVDFSHGCAASNNVGDGNGTVLVKQTLGTFGGNPGRQVLANKGSGYTRTSFDLGSVPNMNWKLQMWWVGVGDFAKRGSDDILFSQQVFRYENGSYRITQTMSAPDLEAQGYTNYHSGIVADLNGDGYPDVVQILSGDGGQIPHLQGAMLAVFLNDGRGNLVYQPNALPARLPTDMGLDIRAFDVNFDGKPDIVSSGGRYMYQTNETDLKARVVYVNNGDGTFTKKNIVDSEADKQCVAAGLPDWSCQRILHFMYNRDSNSYSLVMLGKGYGNFIGYNRVVTKANPLVLQ